MVHALGWGLKAVGSKSARGGGPAHDTTVTMPPFRNCSTCCPHGWRLASCLPAGTYLGFPRGGMPGVSPSPPRPPAPCAEEGRTRASGYCLRTPGIKWSLGSTGCPRHRQFQLLASARTPGGDWGPGQPWPTHPPTDIRKIFLRLKKEISQRGRKFEAEFRYTHFFLASEGVSP